MSTKRKNQVGEGTQTSGSHSRKKAKIQEARQIAVQVPIHVVDVSGSKPLVSLDVERFADARRFEITAMQDAITNARATSSKRSWQKLPRHLRRRAASHDTRRVPAYLREKAKEEMDPPGKSASAKSKSKKAGKNRVLPRTEELLRRQRDKIWLETHIWHAKRMKMETLWGYRLALHPTEKAFRSSHRASKHGCILHDASYHEIIEVRGPQVILVSLIDLCCESSASPGSARYLTGARVCEALLYMPNSYPYDLVGPVTIIWRPAMAPDDDDLSHSPRAVWFICHPSISEGAFRALVVSSSFVVEASESDNKRKHRIEVVDLRGKLNIFELMGPKSSQVIKGALTPVRDDESKEFDRYLQSPGGLPSGMVVGLKVHDPRLGFPPANSPLRASEVLPRQQSIDPSQHLAYSEVWDTTSAPSEKPRFSKRDLDKRRAKNSIPGSKLHPFRGDDRVSLLLIRHTVSSQSSSLAAHGWMMIIPSGWSMPFLASLTYTGALVGGQQQRDTQMLEAGVPRFPQDFPTTEPYREQSEAWEASEKRQWERIPPAKRVNYERLEIDNPWKAEWGNVFDRRIPGTHVPAQRDAVNPWLLSRYLAPVVLDGIIDVPDPAAWLRRKLNDIRLARGKTGLDLQAGADDPWRDGLVQIQVELRGRGTLGRFAGIYPLRDDELPLCASSSEGLRRSVELHHSPQDVIMGYITSGAYSLSRGRPSGIGTVALSKLVGAKEKMLAISSSACMVKVRAKNSNSCYLAEVQLVGHSN